MAKVIDYITLTVAVFMLTFVWTTIAFGNSTAAIVASSAFTLIAIVSVRYFKRRSAKPYSYERLALEFSLRGNEYVIGLIKSGLGIVENDGYVCGKNFILLDEAILISSFNFGALGVRDMCAVCNLAAKYGRKRAYVICRGIERRAYAVAQLENVRVSTIKVKAVYKFLKKRDALPNLKPVKQRPSLKAFFAAILSRGNLKSYLFSGATLIFISFITPLKIYYLTFGSALLLLALLTLTPLGSGSFNSPKIFEELERNVTAKKNDDNVKDADNKTENIDRCHDDPETDKNENLAE